MPNNNLQSCIDTSKAQNDMKAEPTALERQWDTKKPIDKKFVYMSAV